MAREKIQGWPRKMASSRCAFRRSIGREGLVIGLCFFAQIAGAHNQRQRHDQRDKRQPGKELYVARMPGIPQKQADAKGKKAECYGTHLANPGCDILTKG